MKTVLITGASSGLGAEFARQIAKSGKYGEIWLVARREDRLKDLADELGMPSRIITADLSCKEGRDKVAWELKLAKPDIGLLVNCAGFGKYGSYEDLTWKETEDMIEVNCKAMVFITYESLKYMKDGSGILTMASGSSFQPLPYFNMYASTKAFVLHFCRALNMELEDRNITVTAVCPGFVDTEFFKVAKETKNPDACNNFKPLYSPVDVVRRALKDNSKGKDMSVYGANQKFKWISAKILPHKLVMKTWLKIK